MKTTNKKTTKWFWKTLIIAASTTTLTSIVVTDPIKAKNTHYIDCVSQIKDKNNAQKADFIFQDGDYSIAFSPFVNLKSNDDQDIGVFRKNMSESSYSLNASDDVAPIVDSISYENTQTNERFTFQGSNLVHDHKKLFYDVSEENQTPNTKSAISIKNSNLSSSFSQNIKFGDSFKTTVQIIDQNGKNKFLNFTSYQTPKFDDKSVFVNDEKTYYLPIEKNKTNAIEKILFFDCDTDMDIKIKADVDNIGRTSIVDLSDKVLEEDNLQNPMYSFEMVKNKADPRYYDLVFTGEKQDFPQEKRVNVNFSIQTEWKVMDDLSTPKILKDFGFKTISLYNKGLKTDNVETVGGSFSLKPNSLLQNVGRVEINSAYHEGMENELYGVLRYSYNAEIYSSNDDSLDHKPILPDSKDETILGVNLEFAKSELTSKDWSVFDISLRTYGDLATPSFCDKKGFTPCEIKVDYAGNYDESFTEGISAPITSENNIKIKFDLGENEMYFPNKEKKVSEYSQIIYQKNKISWSDIKSSDANSYKNYTVVDEKGNILSDWSVTDETQVASEELESQASNYIEKLDSNQKANLFFAHLSSGETKALRFQQKTWLLILEETIIFVASFFVVGMAVATIYGLTQPMAAEAFNELKKGLYKKQIDAKVRAVNQIKLLQGEKRIMCSPADDFKDFFWGKAIIQRKQKYTLDLIRLEETIKKYKNQLPIQTESGKKYVYGEFLEDINKIFPAKKDSEFMIERINVIFEERFDKFSETVEAMRKDMDKIFHKKFYFSPEPETRAISRMQELAAEKIRASYGEMVHSDIQSKFEKFNYTFEGKAIDSEALLNEFVAKGTSSERRAAISDLIDQVVDLDGSLNSEGQLELSKSYLYSEQYFKDIGPQKFERMEYYKAKWQNFKKCFKERAPQIGKAALMMGAMYAVCLWGTFFRNKDTNQLRIYSTNANDSNDKSLYTNYRQRSLRIRAPEDFEGEKKIKIIPFGSSDNADYIQDKISFNLASNTTDLFTYTSDSGFAKNVVKINDTEKWISVGNNDLVGSIKIDSVNKITKNTPVIAKILSEDGEKIDEKGWSITLSGEELDYRDFSIKVPAKTKHANIKIGVYYEDKNGELALLGSPHVVNILGGVDKKSSLRNTSLKFNASKNRISSDLQTNDCFESLFKFETPFGNSLLKGANVKVASSLGEEMPGWNASIDENTGDISVMAPYYFMGEQKLFVEIWNNGEVIWRSDVEAVYRDRSTSKLDYATHDYLSDKPEKYFQRNKWNEVATYEAIFYQGNQKISIFNDMEHLSDRLKINVREKNTDDKNCPTFKKGLIKDFRIVKISDTQISIQVFVPDVDYQYKLSNGFYYTSLLCEMEIFYGDDFISLPEMSKSAPMYFIIK